MSETPTYTYVASIYNLMFNKTGAVFWFLSMKCLLGLQFPKPSHDCAQLRKKFQGHCFRELSMVTLIDHKPTWLTMNFN